MNKRPYKKRYNLNKSKKVWTVFCILLVFLIAILFRGIALYKIYPLEFKDEITRYSEMYSIDKYFVCAVIYVESRFDEKAASNKGAIGLMQIMPDTGKWAAEKIGLDGYSEDSLVDADVNIHIGCWYLSYLSQLFDRDARKVLAAYNAGPAKVQKWLDDDELLKNIPYEETEQYLNKVQDYYEVYKGLYNF